MLLNEIKPSRSLTEYIRLYRIIDFHFPSHLEIPPKLYSPRPEHCLQFYPKDTETVAYPDSNSVISNKRVTVTGQHTILNSRSVGKEFLSFQVLFQPAAFYRITGVPMQELNNVYLDAEYLFGGNVRNVNEQLAYAASYSEMIAIVERFLTELIRHTAWMVPAN